MGFVLKVTDGGLSNGDKLTRSFIFFGGARTPPSTRDVVWWQEESHETSAEARLQAAHAGKGLAGLPSPLPACGTEVGGSLISRPSTSSPFQESFVVLFLLQGNELR